MEINTSIDWSMKMKKLLFLAMSVLLLAACSDSGADKPDENQNAQPNESAPVEENEKTDFVEYATVTKEIGDTYKVDTEADTDEKRVLLFEDNSGEKVYKSVYLKQNNLLKIYDLKEDRLIFNKFFKGEE